ncbi:MAG: MgtC/SapB family protein [Oscillospiraceae bacterium]|nr:MgtC/SapB family protein [Oscillospiraceae bacterium]
MIEYLNSQFSVWQNLDFFLRIVVSCICGACIGFERSRRYKEAGIRTHIIVCFAAALMMIVSKYGFADLTMPEGAAFNGTRGADPARIAAQVVSGISFLGAGVIFKHGVSIRGLTTAAGLWATAGIGLAIGAGLYSVGIFATVLMLILQTIMHRFLVYADSLISGQLQFTLRTEEEQFMTVFRAFIEERGIWAAENRITYHDGGFVTYEMFVRLPRRMYLSDIDMYLKTIGEVQSISFVSAN